MSQQCTEQSFLVDVASHVLHVDLDQGVYRHLRFRRPGTSCYGFDLITYPGHLVMSGDMGSWVFARTNDMLTFFRDTPRDNDPIPTPLRINEAYWCEKLQAANHDKGAREYSQQVFCEHVHDAVDAWQDDVLTETGIHPGMPRDLDALIEELKNAGVDHEYGAREALRDFEDPLHRIDLTDACTEWRLTEYTYHYVWACYAIVWGIQQYDKLATPTNPENTDDR